MYDVEGGNFRGGREGVGEGGRGEAGVRGGERKSTGEGREGERGGREGLSFDGEYVNDSGEVGVLREGDRQRERVVVIERGWGEGDWVMGT